MAWFNGREPCPYLLDPEHNFVPELQLTAAMHGQLAALAPGRWTPATRAARSAPIRGAERRVAIRPARAVAPFTNQERKS